MVIIDQLIEDETISTSTSVYQLDITSQDAFVLVAYTAGVTTTLSSLTLNGVSFQQILEFQGSNADTEFWIFKNPPMGQVTINVNAANSGYGIAILSLLGVDKSANSYVTNANDAGSGSVSLVLNQVPPGSLIFDILNNGSDPGFPNREQYRFLYDGTNGLAASARYGWGNVIMAWPNSQPSGWQSGAIAIPPRQAPSLWNPNIDFRNPFDVLQANGLDSFNFNDTQPNSTRIFGRFSTQFYKNSFLHTVGRQIASLPIAAFVAELERPTSQIIIDKVFQGQSSSGNTLTMDVNIPNQDAILVVTGGSAIATGGAWQSVTFNGDLLTKLIQAGVANNSAEIWIMWNPPIGTSQVVITPTATTGEAYGNAMVILGVDKTNTSVITASNTDAASLSTISTAITPDVPNVLLIDALAAIDATAPPVSDQSQNLVLYAPSINASEYVMSSYKISSSPDQMTYSLSTAVNAALVVAAFRPARSASFWNPNIKTRSLSDTVDTNALDAGVGQAFGQYGYKPTLFYRNSFLHTVGKMLNKPAAAPTNHWLSLMGAGT